MESSGSVSSSQADRTTAVKWTFGHVNHFTEETNWHPPKLQHEATKENAPEWCLSRVQIPDQDEFFFQLRNISEESHMGFLCSLVLSYGWVSIFLFRVLSSTLRAFTELIWQNHYTMAARAFQNFQLLLNCRFVPHFESIALTDPKSQPAKDYKFVSKCKHLRP